MALRLTGTSQLSESEFTPRELASQAASRLATGDCAGYRALFERAAALADEHDRYHARLLLAESGLTATGHASHAQTATIFLAMAEALIDILGEEPREPLLLNYAGVAFYELWSLDAARAMFKAAQRLDPALPHLRRNLAEVGRRSRGGGPGRRPLYTGLPALARRAKAIAARAQPATGLKLSLCMIVRDEEAMLGQCLAAAAPAVDEIVIVDTGSRDGTVEIARSFGARVIEREWTGSFSEARNASFDAATGDWLVYLDADEVMVAQDAERLRALTGRVWCEAFYLLETSYTGEDGEGTGMTHPALRVFRNRSRYRFEGRLHEQIAHRLPMNVPGRVEHASVRVEHYGYLGSVRGAKEKSRRNIELLRAEQAEGRAGAFVHFNLGTEYAVAGEHRAALAELERAYELSHHQGEEGRDYFPTLLVRLAVARRQCGRYEAAIAVADEGLRRFEGFTDLLFVKAQALDALGRADEAAAAWQRCLQMGDAPARYGASVGCGSHLSLLALAEQRRRLGDSAQALELLERCLDEHPGFVGAIGPYAALRLAGGAAPAEVAALIWQRIPNPTPAARFMLAEALHAHGAADAAAEQYRLVLDARPRSAQVRVQLAETLLSGGTPGEAAELAGAVPEDDPFFALAARIQLWALVAAGRFAELAGAQERAEQAGVPAAEREVFEAWAALAQGRTPAREVPVAGTPLLGVILERLLAQHEFDAFERLAGLLGSSALPRREQQELLASMYLRYGFLQSAAREWMAVCEETPDARALVGLAQVALAHGLPQDAATFAAQALVLAPDHQAARSICERLGTPAAAAA